MPSEILAEVVAASPDRWGVMIARIVVALWDSPQAKTTMLALLRSAMSTDTATRMLREFVTTAILGRLAEALSVPDAAYRASLVVFAGLLDQFSGQVNNVATIVNSVQQSLIGARRVFEILDSPVDVKSAPNAVRRPHLDGAVCLEDVSFGYDQTGQPLLRHLQLDVKPGECVAILGATGSGKSILMGLIPRFYDATGGRVLVDGIDVRNLHLDDLRRNIGLVFQESFLFSNTVAANIAFGHPRATPAQIEKAARIAAAHEFIMRLPRGYDTVLGESGHSFSGGQRQRLAIARAVLLEPAILLPGRSDGGDRQ